MDYQSIIDDAYEAAFLPEFWPKVCESLARVSEAHCCSVVNFSPDGKVKFIAPPELQEAMEKFAKSDIRSPLPQKQIEKMPFSFQRDIDLMDEADMIHDHSKNTFLVPLGLKWQLGDAITEPSGHMIVFDLVRKIDDGPFPDHSAGRLDAMRPDLLRAFFTASRASYQEARTVTKTLEALGLPAMVISDMGRVSAVNALVNNLHPHVSVEAGDRIRVRSSSVQALLDTAILNVAAGKGAQSVPVPSNEEHAAMILNVIPIRRHARDVFSRSAALLIVNRVGEVGPPELRVLCGLFDLTPGEARVAYDLARGMSLEASAKSRQLSVQTSRTHLKRVFRKTATSQQSELVALLLGFGQPT